MARRDDFLQRGFLTFEPDPAVTRWVAAARPVAMAVARDPAQSHWLRCGGTWFVGVDALPNDAEGRVQGGPPLSGAAMDFIRTGLGLALPLHRAQLSVCYPGYPQPSAEESETAYGFRLRRDAAHVDGLLADGPERRRCLKEPHAYILGLTLTAQSDDAAPLVVWEGSHLIMRAVFTDILGRHPPEAWAGIDVTAAYQAARRDVFASCKRIALPASPGQAVLLHRHLLHGVAPWPSSAEATGDGRMIAYFRPEFPNLTDWLSAP
jgi:hypothetical protein